MAQRVEISCITPTVRPEGLKLVHKALRRQTLRNFEWIITTPRENFDIPLIDGIDVSVMQDPPKQEDEYWTLNASYNQSIMHAQGDLIVSIQDWTYCTPEALRKFRLAFDDDPTRIVSGVGNKYQSDDFIVQTWQDPRERDDFGSFYETTFENIEGNFAAVPKQAFYDVGGFDEELDKHAGMDFYSVMERIEMHGGYSFWLDQTNKSYSLEHGRLPYWEEKNAIYGAYEQRRRKYIESPVLPYL